MGMGRRREKVGWKSAECRRPSFDPALLRTVDAWPVHRHEARCRIHQRNDKNIPRTDRQVAEGLYWRAILLDYSLLLL